MVHADSMVPLSPYHSSNPFVLAAILLSSSLTIMFILLWCSNSFSVRDRGGGGATKAGGDDVDDEDEMNDMPPVAKVGPV